MTMISQLDLALGVQPLPSQVLSVQWIGREKYRKAWKQIGTDKRRKRSVTADECVRFWEGVEGILVDYLLFYCKKEMRSLAKNSWGGQPAKDQQMVTTGKDEGGGLPEGFCLRAGGSEAEQLCLSVPLLLMLLSSSVPNNWLLPFK